MKNHPNHPNPTLVFAGLFLAVLGGIEARGQEGVRERLPGRQSGSSQVIGGDQLIAQADAPPVAAVARTRTAAIELKKARELLTRHSSIQARIVEQVSLGDRSYKAEGRYLQLALKPGAWQMRMELLLKVGESEGSLLEVCNGSVLWTRTEIDAGGGMRKTGKSAKDRKKELTVTRRNVQRILDAARKSGDFSEQTETDLLVDLGLGGLPALLASLEQDMKFGAVKEEVFRDRPVLLITGTWSEAVSARMRRPGPGGSLGLLPPTVPDQMKLYLDKETGFPYRLLYLKRVPNRDLLKPMLTLDFRDVVLNEPISPTEFEYEPPQGVEIDLTNNWLERFAPQSAPAGK